MDKNEIIRFIEPVYHFCLHRVSSRADAEDLASEIMLHVLDGLTKYKITSLEAWVWRIAHNRYARFIDAKSALIEIPSDETAFDIADDYDFVDDIAVEDEFAPVFRYLHTLSSEYKNIIVDYYIGELPVKVLAQKYSLSESTIKWRLNISRQKIRERIGENKMDKVYKRINWNTTTCNGSMDSDKYLHTQISRAICEAAYEKPLTIEGISLKTGIPTMYIEDELPRLEYGDAIAEVNGKYATDFLILRLSERAIMEKKFAPLVSSIADYFEAMFDNTADKVKQIGFYGCDRGMAHLGYIALPVALRSKIGAIKNSLPNLANGAYPPRKDGGYGWFLVQESADGHENMGEYSAGCNVAGDDSGSAGNEKGHIYYMWLAKYFVNNIYHNGGTRWLCAKDIPQKSKNGMIPDGLLSEDDIICLLKANLIIKADNRFRLNFAMFTKEQFADFTTLFNAEDERLNNLLTGLILDIHKSFKSFVPKRLDSQINQWVSCFSHEIIGYVADELVARGVLCKPDEEKPLTDGVFYVDGEYICV
ncbi:MAG: sigma-70 family RNA polymerase sigma factor [Eubacteriales bacterium]|nr:sigma-70 family RNA polymerase sigma factor [Eubacteriales bacterium]